MKHLRHVACSTAAALIALAVTGCSEHYDDAKYASKPPQFVEMTFTNIDNPNAGIVTGDRIVACAVQSEYGRLLNRTTYTWAASPDVGLSHTYTSGVVYDNQPQNPADTIVFTNAGTYTVTFSARYNSSGNNVSYSGTRQFSEGKELESTSGISSFDITRVTYVTGGLLYYNVTVERSVRVASPR